MRRLVVVIAVIGAILGGVAVATGSIALTLWAAVCCALVLVIERPWRAADRDRARRLHEAAARDDENRDAALRRRSDSGRWPPVIGGG